MQSKKKATNIEIGNVYKIIPSSESRYKVLIFTTITDKIIVYICQNLPKNYVNACLILNTYLKI